MVARAANSEALIIVFAMYICHTEAVKIFIRWSYKLMRRQGLKVAESDVPGLEYKVRRSGAHVPLSPRRQYKPGSFYFNYEYKRINLSKKLSNP